MSLLYLMDLLAFHLGVHHLVHRALSDDAIMMVGLRLIIMNTACFVAFLV